MQVRLLSIALTLPAVQHQELIGLLIGTNLLFFGLPRRGAGNSRNYITTVTNRPWLGIQSYK